MPVNLRQFRGFLGLSGYYRKFVRGYAEVAAPLTALTRQNQPFSWTGECQAAFDALKQALVSPPVLAMPDDHGTFILDTDASDSSIGAVLSQVQGGVEKVIAYAGRSLSKQERNYCVTRRELLAIVHFARYFRQYLLGRRFTIWTDHAALTWLQRTPEPIGQNARWLELLGEFFDIKHRAGTSHGNADALSRRPCPCRTPCTACRPPRGSSLLADGQPHSTNPDPPLRTRVVKAKPAVQPVPAAPGPDALGWSKDEIAAEQLRDPAIGPIYCWIRDGLPKPPAAEASHLSQASKTLWQRYNRLQVVDGVLRRSWQSPRGDSVVWQVVLPCTLRSAFLTLAHTGITGGHLGRTRTEEQVRRRAYWPEWTADVALLVKCCGPCATYHRGGPPRQADLHPFVAGEPFELVSVDVTGPHSTSARGHQYIITCADSFSKWAEAYPVRMHTAQVVARVLYDGLISRFACPVRILSDQGPEFESKMFAELCHLLDIEKIRTTAYKPSTNGNVERYHSTLNSMLAKVVACNQRDWDLHVPPVLAAYRASRHESTGFSPNYMLFGRENRAPWTSSCPIAPTARTADRAST